MAVSTHPPPHRRREPAESTKHAVDVLFQPTLRLIGGGNGSHPGGRRGPPGFNPPSASSAEGTPSASGIAA